MLDRIRELQKEIEEIAVKTAEELEELRIKYLSKKGEISRLMEDFRNVSADQKKDIGQAVNTQLELQVIKVKVFCSIEGQYQ